MGAVTRLVDREPVECLSSIADDWHETDGAMRRGDGEDALRMTEGPRWEANSCALDCLLMMAMLLGAGRTITDQQPPQTPLVAPALLLHRIVKTPWGSLSLEDKTELRQILRKNLVKHERTLSMRGQMSLNLIFDIMFKGLPQLSFTQATRFICTQGGPPQFVRRSDGKVRTSLITSLTLGGDDDTIQDYFRAVSPLTKDTISRRFQCRAHESCIAKQWEVVIVDRMPPRLCIFWEREDDMRAPSELAFKYPMSSGQSEAARYHLKSWVVLRRQHFTLHWKSSLDGGFAHYDGMNPSVTHDGEDGTGDQGKQVLVCYERIVS